MYIHKVVPHQLRWVPKSTHRGTENHCGCIRVVQKLISSSVFCAILGYYMLLNIIVPCLFAFSNIVLLVGFFPTCQVRVVRFYLSCLLLLLPASSSPPLLLLSSSSSRCPPPLVVLLVSLSSSSSCSTATRDPQCSLPDLNHDHPRPVFPAGPQPRPSTPSVPCRTSTTAIHAQWSLPDLNHGHPRPVFPAGPQPRPSTPSVPCRTSTASIHAKCSLPDLM